MRWVDFDDYEHEAGECLRVPYAHFTGARWCGHPLCMFESRGGDLDAIEEGLAEQGYDRQQVSRMIESFYVPLLGQRDEEQLRREGGLTSRGD
jgi:hypothetical protein